MHPKDKDDIEKLKDNKSYHKRKNMNLKRRKKDDKKCLEAIHNIYYKLIYQFKYLLEKVKKNEDIGGDINDENDE